MKKTVSSPPRIELHTSSPAETEALGNRIGKLLRSGDILRLSGNLGAGKTCLARGIARGWGALETASSPTFALINEYDRPDGSRLYHVDGYRLAGVDDAVSTGLEDALAAGQFVVIEWPERVAALLPADSLLIELSDTGESTRQLIITAGGAASQRLVDALSDANS